MHPELHRNSGVIAARYQLTTLIGRGASSDVFAAHDRLLGRRVALKLMKQQASGEEQRRFELELGALRRLRHPHLVQVLGWGLTCARTPYLVLELLDGEDLTRRLEREGRLDVEETLRVLFPVMGVLACAHDLGIIHRDVKPANIFLHRGPAGQLVPKLLDLGIAWSPDREPITSTGVALGSAGYMAPERRYGGALDPSVDVWSLGVTMFRCLTGRLPQLDEPCRRIAHAGLGRSEAGSTPVGPSLHAALPAPLALVLERALDRQRERRHRSAREFARALVQAACRAGVALPQQPDAIGLPEYQSWWIATTSEELTSVHAPIR